MSRHFSSAGSVSRLGYYRVRRSIPVRTVSQVPDLAVAVAGARLPVTGGADEFAAHDQAQDAVELLDGQHAQRGSG